jgi:hypothetical protein
MQAVCPGVQTSPVVRFWNSEFRACAVWPFWRRVPASRGAIGLIGADNANGNAARLRAKVVMENMVPDR